MSEITPAHRLAQDIKTDVTLIARIDEQPGGDVEVGTAKKPIDCTSYPLHPFKHLLLPFIVILLLTLSVN